MIFKILKIEEWIYFFKGFYFEVNGLLKFLLTEISLYSYLEKRFF